jgi:hypothetical protein
MANAETIEFNFSADWDTLTKTAVFTDGKVTVDVLQSRWLTGNTVNIPAEVLATAGRSVRVGVYGANADGLILPTVWVTLGKVMPAAEPSGDPGADPTLPIWAQLQNQIGDLDDLTTKAKNNLVAAINEAAKTGSGGAGSIDLRTADGYIQYSNDGGATWENLIALADLKGEKGDTGATGPQGQQGPAGKTPVKGTDYFTEADKQEIAEDAAAMVDLSGKQDKIKASGLLKGDGAGGVETAMPGTDYLMEAPVTSVNGATGAVKGTFYVTVTQGHNASVTADKTAEEVYAAYVAGYAVYAIVKFAGAIVPYTLPLLAAASVSGTVVLGFATVGSSNENDNPQFLIVLYNGAAWSAWIDTLARSRDIPKIPTELKNPYSLVIKIGNEMTSYDGSAAKTVEIPEGGGTDESLGITGASAGKIPKIKAVDAAGKPTQWEATALPDEAFIVHFTLERPLVGNPTITSDRTLEEVTAAIAAKKQVIALLDENNTIIQLYSIASSINYLYFYTIKKQGAVVGIGWQIDIDMEGGKTSTLTTMAPWNFIGYNGVSGSNQIFGTGDTGGYEFKQHILFDNLPEVTTSDNGKFMRVVNGAWAVETVENANGGSF